VTARLKRKTGHPYAIRPHHSTKRTPRCKKRARPEPALACVRRKGVELNSRVRTGRNPLRLVDGNSHDKSHTSWHLREVGDASPDRRRPRLTSARPSCRCQQWPMYYVCHLSLCQPYFPPTLNSSFFFPSPFKDLTEYLFSTALSNQITWTFSSE
jgi:hypothetical protein